MTECCGVNWKRGMFSENHNIWRNIEVVNSFILKDYVIVDDLHDLKVRAVSVTDLNLRA